MERFGIYNYCSGRIELSYEEGFLVISVKEEAEATKEDFARYVREELEDDDLDPEEFLAFDQRLPVQRCREIFYNISLAAFRRSTNEMKRSSEMNPTQRLHYKLFWNRFAEFLKVQNATQMLL